MNFSYVNAHYHQVVSHAVAMNLYHITSKSHNLYKLHSYSYIIKLQYCLQILRHI